MPHMTEIRTWTAEGTNLYGPQGSICQSVEFPKSGATVIRNTETQELHIQFFDSYTEQYEMAIVPHEGRRGSTLVAPYMELFSTRGGNTVRRSLADHSNFFETLMPTDLPRLCDRIWDLTKRHPILLWNEPMEGSLEGRNAGMLQVFRRLKAGALVDDVLGLM